MKFKINKEIFQKFPEVVIGLLAARDIDNQGESQEVIDLIRQREKEIRENFNSETLSQNPKVSSWRQAYSAFGAKPKEYKCSVENLYRMILKKVELRRINKIVDIYNYISIKHLIPAGGDDIDKIDGDIILRFARGNEPFQALNSEEIKNPKSGEVVYTDDKEILCRRWNWRECNKSKMTEQTKNVAIIVEGLPPVKKEEIEKIIEELGSLIKRHCGGELESFVLDVNNQGIDI